MREIRTYGLNGRLLACPSCTAMPGSTPTSTRPNRCTGASSWSERELVPGRVGRLRFSELDVEHGVNQASAIRIMIEHEGPLDPMSERVEVSAEPLDFGGLLKEHPVFGRYRDLKARLQGETVWYVRIAPVHVQFGGDKTMLISSKDGRIVFQSRGK
jgi:hypothetical protein